jgi:uracil-DNA glycosylase
VHSTTERTVTSDAAIVRRLRVLHAELDACTACPNMIRPVVHGAPVASRILLVGQAPGPREGSFGRPFAWTAGKTLFRWFEEALGVGEEEFRAKVYVAAVARCFPGKASGGGDRRPDADEIARCRPFLARETEILQPKLILPVGTLAIEQVLGTKEKLNDLIGSVKRASYQGVMADIVPLPHPSGASPWHKMEPGKTLLGRALGEIAKHPEVKRTFGR